MTETATAESRHSALDAISAEIAASATPVREICARHGVPWQSFYAHARREGLALRRPVKGASGLALIGQFKAVVQTAIAKLAAAPEPAAAKFDAARRLHTDTLARLIKMEKDETTRANRQRRKRRTIFAARRAELTRRLDEITRGPNPDVEAAAAG